MEMSWDDYKHDQCHCSLPVATHELPRHTACKCLCVAKWAILGILASLDIEN
jgi:hypothetical protein